MIQNIAIDRLRPHPNNPRRDLGDLAELADSIRAQGVLQNLTVVPRPPGYCQSCKLYDPVLGACVEGHDGTERPPCSKWEYDGTYTVVIGHRRLEAAKMAGLTELPCAVAEMDEQTQVETMLLENLQRSDLTIVEQAHGFQMLIDFGESVSDIAERTGFSETTVRHRVRLMDLDQDRLAEAVGRNVTLDDLDKLSQIKDPGLRDEVLGKAGTPNFEWAVKSALATEANAKKKALLVDKLDAFAKRIKEPEAKKYNQVRYVPLDDGKFEAPPDAGEKNYYYTAESGIWLYTDKTRGEKPQKTSEEVEREARAERIRSLFGLAYETRCSFARKFRGTAKNADAVYGKAIHFLYNQSAFDEDVFRDVFGIGEKFRYSWQLDKGDGRETYEEALARVMDENAKAHKATLLFWGIYCRMEDPRENCLDRACVYERNEELEELYAFLCEIGYRMSDEEKALLEGTHELYDKDEAPDDDEDEYDDDDWDDDNDEDDDDGDDDEDDDNYDEGDDA